MRSNIRRYPDGWGETHPLSGLVFCADCGNVMYIHRINNGKRNPLFDCSNYHKVPVGKKCPTAHRIYASVIMELIKETLKEIMKFSKEDEEEFKRMVKETAVSQQDTSFKDKKVRLNACLKRRDELEMLICKIYEDNALGKLSEKRYQLLDSQYGAEQASLDNEIQELKDEIEKSEDNRYSASKFIALVKKYQDFEELTTPMLIEFIDKILVHERQYKGRIDSPQTIEIYFNFIGQLALPCGEPEKALTPEEIEQAEKKEKRRQKLHESYLKRKASGKAAAYYLKVKEEKKAKMDADKEKIRAEDRTNGIYYLPNQSTEEDEKLIV
ncbi:MAG: DUF4368 domain-containing protein [Clostridiales bacterium]|nr:DUF4368 domain-containing protein [Clostridiales bacterium]